MQDLPSPATYRTIGLMSGSSLDGLDMACCDFTCHDGVWSFAIRHADCASYDTGWTDRLRNARNGDARSLWQLHADFGHFCGRAVKKFITDHNIENPLLVGSHGHTVFHFPRDGFTTQVGDGAALASECGVPVVCDFRSLDVAHGGQGAPLVPIGDTLLFGAHKFLLNIGGIANITVRLPSETIAFDICGANQVLNFYAGQQGRAYDDNGATAAAGKLNKTLFDALNALDYYREAYPKSLDNGYSHDMVIPLIDRYGLSIADKLHTFCEHIAYQIGEQGRAFAARPDDMLLVTGGGALNGHLMRRIAHYMPVQITPVDETIIQYKEALVFAFMGLLRWRGETNSLASVTGARRDTCGGAVYLP